MIYFCKYRPWMGDHWGHWVCFYATMQVFRIMRAMYPTAQFRKLHPA